MVDVYCRRDYLYEEYMCNKTWLMFIVVEMNKTTTLKLGKVLVCSEDCKRTFFYKRYIFPLNPRLQKISKFNQRIKNSIFNSFIHFPCLLTQLYNLYTCIHRYVYLNTFCICMQTGILCE